MHGFQLLFSSQAKLFPVNIQANLWTYTVIILWSVANHWHASVSVQVYVKKKCNVESTHKSDYFHTVSDHNISGLMSMSFQMLLILNLLFLKKNKHNHFHLFICISVFLFTSGFHCRPQLPLVPLGAPGFSAPLGHHPHPLHFGLALGEYGRAVGTLL